MHTSLPMVIQIHFITVEAFKAPIQWLVRVRFVTPLFITVHVVFTITDRPTTILPQFIILTESQNFTN